MKKYLLLCLSVMAIVSANAQARLHPVIKDYGVICDVPYAIDKPDPSMKYNIIVEASAPVEHPDSVYNPLEHVARMYNLHVYGGVPKKNLHIDLVIFAAGIHTVLNNEAYRKKFGVDNPNLKIIEEMTEAGINIYACGQSVSFSNIDPAAVNPDIKIVLSRATTVSTRQMKGYAFFKF